jgi:hypothetical protein
VRIDDDHVFRTNEDCGIAIDLRLGMRMREEDAFGCLLQVEEIARRSGRCRIGPRGTVVCQFKHRSAGECATHEHAQEISPRALLDMIVLTESAGYSGLVCMGICMIVRVMVGVRMH